MKIQNSAAALAKTLKPFFEKSQLGPKERVSAYWQMGQLTALALGSFSRQGRSTAVQSLKKRLQVSSGNLYRWQKFYRLWPESVPQIKGVILSWDHHVQLLSVDDETARRFYWREASAQNWTRGQLKQAIQNDLYARSLAGSATGLKRDPDPLYIYKALVESVIDGDTLHVRIDLGFNTWVTQKVRLRGINASEMKSPDASARKRAEAAKAFVQKALAGVAFVVIKSYRVDLHGRFVADVFYHPKLKNKSDVAQKGLFLNDELIKAGLADLV